MDSAQPFRRSAATRARAGRRRGTAGAEQVAVIVAVALAAASAVGALGDGMSQAIAESAAGRARSEEREGADAAPAARRAEETPAARRADAAPAAQAGVVDAVRSLARSAGSHVAHAPGATTKRLFPNTRVVVEAGINGGAWPSFGTGIGFVRENDLRVGRNGVYGSASAGWLVGGVRKFKSHRPELSSARGAVSKEVGLFAFGDPVRGLKTHLELPVPLAAWMPLGLVPGLGAAEHAGRPGVLFSLQLPVVLLPWVGDGFAKLIHGVFPGAESGGALTRLANVTTLRVAVNVGIYHPRLARYARAVNAGARRLDPHIRRFTDAVGRVREAVTTRLWLAREVLRSLRAK